MIIFIPGLFNVSSLTEIEISLLSKKDTGIYILGVLEIIKISCPELSTPEISSNTGYATLAHLTALCNRKRSISWFVFM